MNRKDFPYCRYIQLYRNAHNMKIHASNKIAYPSNSANSLKQRTRASNYRTYGSNIRPPASLTMTAPPATSLIRRKRLLI